jgi:hypothetical protein
MCTVERDLKVPSDVESLLKEFFYFTVAAEEYRTVVFGISVGEFEGGFQGCHSEISDII